jgi:hypothetical protein
VESDQEDEDVDEMLLHGGASSALLAADNSVKPKAPSVGASAGGIDWAGAALLRASTNISQYSIQRVPRLGGGDKLLASKRHRDPHADTSIDIDDDDDDNAPGYDEGDMDFADADGDNADQEPPPPPVRNKAVCNNNNLNLSFCFSFSFSFFLLPWRPFPQFVSVRFVDASRRYSGIVAARAQWHC